MEEQEVTTRLNRALREVEENDRYLLEFDLSERSIVSRVALYLQNEFPDFNVDVEYNRDGATPKRLGLPQGYANFNENGQVLVVPDVIVHRRGHDGPNILVLEVKKTTNAEPRDYDRERVRALRTQLRYEFGAQIECETRRGHQPAIPRMAERVDRYNSGISVNVATKGCNAR
jgi:hypothetical protein